MQSKQCASVCRRFFDDVQQKELTPTGSRQRPRLLLEPVEKVLGSDRSLTEKPIDALDTQRGIELHCAFQGHVLRCDDGRREVYGSLLTGIEAQNSEVAGATRCI